MRPVATQNSLKVRSRLEKRRQLVLYMWNQGLTNKKIASCLKINHYVVLRIVQVARKKDPESVIRHNKQREY